MYIFNSHELFFKSPFGAVPTGGTVSFRFVSTITIRPPTAGVGVPTPCAGAPAEEVTLRIWRDESETLVPMKMESCGDSANASGSADTLPFSCASGSSDILPPGCAGGSADTLPFSCAGGAGNDAPPVCLPPGCAVYQATYDVGEKPGLVWYYFVIKAASGETRYYGNNPEMLGGAGVECPQPPWSYQLTVYDRGFHVPAWLRHGVIYQIFPDRFCQRRAKPLTQADVEAKRPDYILHADWGDKPIYTPDPRTGEVMNNDFFGGNLAGIASKLPYLKSLGISIVYLNPIFEAYSNHRYDTGDYRKIDALLGTSADFASLCAQARKLGIRLILDGVFNHTGSDSAYFNRGGHYKSLGAYQSKKSKYYGWYMFEDYPDKYKCWWGIETLPDIDESDPGAVEYLLGGGDSVIKHWLRQGASGWRLDVVDELKGEFVKLLRKNVKEADPDAAIIGEVWEDASNKVSYGKRREYFLGHELDSVMNYVFKNALIAFVLGDIDAARFGAENRRLAENYPKECYYSLMNLIGGHDTARILTLLSDPPEGLTRFQKSIHKPTLQKRRLGVRRLKLVSLVQMTFPGAPSVYYGDEAGMAGFEDPFNRCAYPWDGVDGELLGWYRRAIGLRNGFAALRTGSLEALCADGPCYVYARQIRGGRDEFGDPAEDGFALVAVNRDKDGAARAEIDLSRHGIAELHELINSGVADNCEGCADTAASYDGDTAASYDGDPAASYDGDPAASYDGDAAASYDGDHVASYDGDAGANINDNAASHSNNAAIYDGDAGASYDSDAGANSFTYANGRLSLALAPLGCLVLASRAHCANAGA